jgi:hypothetical protein
MQIPLLGRALCAIGAHDWPKPARWGAVVKCRRCPRNGIQKANGVHPVEFTEYERARRR